MTIREDGTADLSPTEEMPMHDNHAEVDNGVRDINSTPTDPTDSLPGNADAATQNEAAQQDMSDNAQKGASEAQAAPASSGGFNLSGMGDLIPLLLVVVSSLLAAVAFILLTPPVVSGTQGEDIANPPVNRVDEGTATDVGDVDNGEQGDNSSPTDYAFTEDVLGVYEARTTAADAAVRARNLAVAARALNGIEIEQGGMLSLNEVIGEPTVERGYEDVPGTEYATDAIDQVATALYIASLKAGLSVPVRYAHVIAVDYAPLGMDAAVSWGLDDLVIHNDLQGTVTVQATAVESAITISIFGTNYDPSVIRDVSATTIDTYTRPASEVYDDPLAQGYLSSDSIRFSVVKTFLETYRDGEEESIELLHVDTYQMPSASSDGARDAEEVVE